MSDNRYLDDNSTDESFYEEGIISPKTLLIGAALIAGGKVAYSKGLLKPLIKEGLELTSEHKPALSVGFNEMRRWLKSSENVPENSLFRTSIKDIAGSIIKQDKDVALDIINSTKEDVGIFTKMFNDTLDRIHKSDPRDLIINNYTNTSILNDQKRGAQEVRKYSQAQAKSRITMRSKVYDSIFEHHHRTEEQLQEQLKRTGFRPVTAADLLDEQIDDKGFSRFFENSKFNFSQKGKNEKNAPIEHLENMFNHEVYTDNGDKIFKNNRLYTLRDKYDPKNIILDENLLRDEAGKIIDLRGKKRELNKSINNLATEWKVPFINFNPLTMFGLDKKGRAQTNFGFISENSIAPALTGIRGNSVENTIKNVKANHDKLKDVKEGVMIINGDVYTVAGEKGIKKLDYKYKKNITYIPKHKAHNTGSFTVYENAQRKMQGITNASYNSYTEDDGAKYIYEKIANALDIGKQEQGIVKDKNFDILDYSNPDAYVEKFLSKIGLSINPHKDKTEYNNITEMFFPGFKTEKQDTLFVTNQAITLKDLKVNKFNKEIVGDYAKQYFANFNKDSELVNERTGILHFIGDRLNSAISTVGFGMSTDSLASPLSTVGNVITKRFLPIYGAYQGWNMLNAITEGEDDEGQKTNINRTIMEGYSRLDLGASYVRDKLGITNVAKSLTELMPGYDQIEELPVIKNINLHESAQERKDYWEYGKDPVRKSRYWSISSNSSFTGGKIDYFKLNPLQAAKADAKYSDSQFGSRREYFANILNPYHYDNKHYQDRPYLLTSPAFENVPIFGDVLAGTVGKIAKPQVKMHKEYWNDDGTVKTSNQIMGDQAIYETNQSRVVSKGVSDFMNKEAGITANEVYKKSFKDRIKEYSKLAKEKAIEITQSGRESIRKATNNSFKALFVDNSIYSTQNLTVKEATLEATEPYTNIKSKIQSMKKIDDSEYYNVTPNYSSSIYFEDINNTKEAIQMATIENIDDSRIARKLYDTYQASGFNYLPKEDYSQNNQVKLTSELVPTTQIVGNTILTVQKEDTSSYLAAVGGSLKYKYYEPNPQVNASESGIILGEDKDFESMINFDNEYDLSNRNMVYRTGSGNYQIINTGKEIDPITSVNLNKESPMSFIGGGNKGVSLNSDYIINKNDLLNKQEENIENPNGIKSTIKNQIANTENVAGMRGFLFNTAITGETNQKGRTVIDTPSYSRSFNKTFWDEDLGGFGGDISEIFRRLVQKRTTNGVEYYNPVRNTMPDFLPGENGFIDFQHGDPFCLSKDTIILTERGYVRAESVTINDIILTHKGEHMPVKDTIVRPILNGERCYRFNIANIDSQIPLEFSEEHPILIKELGRCSFGSSCICRPHVRNFNGFCDNHNCNSKWKQNQLRFVKSKDVNIGDAVAFPIPIYKNENEVPYSYDWSDAPRSKSYTIYDSLILNKDLSWFLGLYCAEGSTAKGRKGLPARLIFSLNISETDVIKRVSDIMEDISGKRPILSTRGNCTDVILCCSKTARMIDSIISGNLYEKRIPKEIYSTTKENMISFVFGFMLGDGHARRNLLTGTTANRDLAFDIHKLMMYSGIPASITIRKTRASYEVSTHPFHLRDLDLSDLMYKSTLMNFNFKRQPNVLSWSDGEYIYSIVKNKVEINLDEVYGFEVDIDDTFCVIGFATHNTKIIRGEERLPGEGFERAYGIDIDDYRITSSRLGKSREELIEHFLERDDITEKYQQDIVKKGTRMHEQVEKYMLDNYIALDSEQEIWDRKNNISGIYDVKIIDDTSKTGESIIDIKTINDKGFREVVNKGLPKEEHVKQVNFYLHNTNKDNGGGILYVNRDTPNQMYMTKFNYSEKLYNDVIDNVNYARNEVKSAIDSGQISRAERYKPIDKMRILADVAPYSTEYDDMKKYVRSMDLSEEQKKEVQNIEDMVTQQRKQLRTYEYRFKTADVKKSKVKITRQIDDNKFMTDDYDDPIKLAGVDLPNKADDKERHDKAMQFINKNVKGRVEIKVAKDEHLRTNKDTLGTMNAVVYSNGMNINRELIKRGLADEKEDDYSAAGVHARFNSLQRNFGSAWETIAHQNTIVNNKLLRVRSAKEDYERQQVYGKDWKSWTKPVQDFIKPMIWSSMNDETGTDRLLGSVGGMAIGSFFGGAYGTKGIVIGATAGAVIGGTTGMSIGVGAFTGSLFGKSKFGKLLGAAVGASTVIGFKTYKTGYEGVTGKKWTPKEKRRENEVVDYLDKLEFVKNKRMFEIYSQKALNEDGIDIKQILEDSKEKGDKAKGWAKKIEKIKKEQKKSGHFDTREYEKAGLKFDPNDKRHPLLRKDEGNKKEKENIKSKKKTLEKERKKVKDKYNEIILDNVEYSKDNNYNLKSDIASNEDKEIIKKQKDKISKKQKSIDKATKTYVENAKNRKQKALDHTINQRIEKAKTSKEITMTSPNAMKAIEYYNKSKQTMYGYEQGDSIADFVAALPKKDKKYFNEILKAGEKERKEILEMAPKYMKRALQSSYGLEVDEKEDLSEYFSEHYLPDENWDGWQESYDFDAIRTKVISKEGFNLASHNIWEDDKNMANMYGQTQLPNIDYKTQDIQAVKNQLMSVLGEAGFSDLDITFSKGASSGSINLDLYEDKKEKFEEKIIERLGQ